MQPENGITFERLEDVESILRAKYASTACDGRFLVRFLGMSGPRGSRCLTLNFESRHEDYQQARVDLDAIIERIRDEGFTVDELLQKVSEEALDTRFWLLVYEPGAVEPPAQ